MQHGRWEFSAFSLFAACLLVCCGARGGEGLNVAVGPAGLTRLSFDNENLLQDGAFKVLKVVLRTGENGFADGDVKTPAVQMDQAAQKLTQKFAWGAVTCHYQTKGNRLELAIEVANATQNQSISAITIQVMALGFPQGLKDYPGWPLLRTNLDEPTILLAHDAALGLAVCNDDVIKPLAVSFGKIGDKPMTCAVTLKTCQKTEKWPLIDRPIKPQGTDHYDISVRFGGPQATANELAGDVLDKFRQAYPYQVKWTDHRPIGYVMLASSHKTLAENIPNNPRGWVFAGDQKKLNINDPATKASLKTSLLAYADNTIKVLKDANAQGIITWDCEGQEWPHATSYIGDPRMAAVVAPEIDPLLDDYFKRYTSAGLKTGICIRPTLPTKMPNGKVEQRDVPDVVKNLMEKVAYAKKRWGCTLYYVDSNVHPFFWRENVASEASIFRKLLEAYPDCLFIPEHENFAHYAYGAPLHVFTHNIARTPASILEVYPQAFGVFMNDGVPPGKTLQDYWPDMVAGVKQGDIYLFRAWFDDNPFNSTMKRAYAEGQKK